MPRLELPCVGYHTLIQGPTSPTTLPLNPALVAGGSFASAAAARDGLYALDFVADSVVKDGVGQEDQPVQAWG